MSVIDPRDGLPVRLPGLGGLSFYELMKANGLTDLSERDFLGSVASGLYTIADDIEAGLLQRDDKLITPHGVNVALLKRGLKTIFEFGAKGDAREITDATFPAERTIRSLSSTFTAADIGKRVLGAGFNDGKGGAATIVAIVSPTTILVDALTEPMAGRIAYGTDDTAAIQAAIASKSRVLLPALETGYLVTGMLDDSQGRAWLEGVGVATLYNRFAANGTPYKTTALQLSAKGSRYRYLRLLQASASASYAVYLTAAANDNRFYDFHIKDGNSGITCCGYENHFDYIYFHEMRASGLLYRRQIPAAGDTNVYPAPHSNRIRTLRGRNLPNAGVMHTTGAHHNTGEDIETWCDPTQFSDFHKTGISGGPPAPRPPWQVYANFGFLGGDVVGFTAETNDNSYSGVRGRGKRDAFCTLNGARNKISHFRFEIGIAGALAIVGNGCSADTGLILNVKNGALFRAIAGGVGARCSLINVLVQDCFGDGVSIYGPSAARIFATLASYNDDPDYIIYDDGLRIRLYRAFTPNQPDGTTSTGSIPPTHETDDPLWDATEDEIGSLQRAGALITPGDPTIVSYDNHALSAGRAFTFSGGGLPAGITAGLTYYVVAPTDDTFQFASNPGGTPIVLDNPGTGTYAINPVPLTRMGVTIATGAPATFTVAAHGFVDNRQVKLTTTGSLPTLVNPSDGSVVNPAMATLYVVGATADAFQLAASRGGAPLQASGAQSGVHSAVPVPMGTRWDFVVSVASSTGLKAVQCSCTNVVATNNVRDFVSYDETRLLMTNCFDSRGPVVEVSPEVLRDGQSGVTMMRRTTDATPAVLTFNGLEPFYAVTGLTYSGGTATGTASPSLPSIPGEFPPDFVLTATFTQVASALTVPGLGTLSLRSELGASFPAQGLAGALPLNTPLRFRVRTGLLAYAHPERATNRDGAYLIPSSRHLPGIPNLLKGPSSVHISGLVEAVEPTTGKRKTWPIDLILRRTGTSIGTLTIDALGTTSLSHAPRVGLASPGTETWGCTITVDNTSTPRVGGLKAAVTGAAATTIEWKFIYGVNVVQTPDPISLFKAWVGALPVANTGLNVGDYWNNGGIVTRVEAA